MSHQCEYLADSCPHRLWPELLVDFLLMCAALVLIFYSLFLFHKKAEVNQIIFSHFVHEATTTPAAAGGTGNTTAIDVVFTSFTSMPSQTDDTPCIAADGTDICKTYDEYPSADLCASNDFPIDSTILISNTGDNAFVGTCLVVDRLARRKHNQVDLYFGYDKDCLDDYQKGDVCDNWQRALQFGVQHGTASLLHYQE